MHVDAAQHEERVASHAVGTRDIGADGVTYHQRA